MLGGFVYQQKHIKGAGNLPRHPPYLLLSDLLDHHTLKGETIELTMTTPIPQPPAIPFLGNVTDIDSEWAVVDDFKQPSNSNPAHS